MGILKKSKEVKSEPMDLFLANFAGEQVEIVVNKDTEVPVAAPGDEEFQLVTIPLTIRGYITDHDDKFIYLGLSPNQINQAVQKDYVVHIGIYDESIAEFDADEDGKMPAGKFN